MKKLYVFILLLALSIGVAAQSTSDTVFIPQSQALEISNIINADTSVTDYRVYVLDRGAKYFIENAFEINSNCKFMSQGDESLAPALLLSAIRADNSSEEWYFKLIETGIEVELDGLYLLSMRPDGQTLGWSRGIWVGSDEISLKMRNVVMEGFTEAGLKVTSKNYSLDVQDCHFRNFQHGTSYFGGQPFLSDQLPFNTISFINNTFFACNSYIFSVRGHGKAVFEHNTMVYTVVNPFLIRQASDLVMDNNLFYGAHAWGGNPTQIIGGWFFNYPDTASTSIYRLRKKGSYTNAGSSLAYPTTGPEAYDDSSAGLIFVPSERVHQALNNNNSNPEALVKFYSDWNDTVATYDSVDVLTGPKQYLLRKLTMADWATKLTLEHLDSLGNSANWDYAPGVKMDANTDLDPGFTNTDMLNHVDELVGYVNRIASSQLDQPWYYKQSYPITWPLPESFEYTNSALLSGGTDGFAVGDLNWFPEQKKAWEEGTSVEVIDNTIADEYTLGQNYPNPFNPTTTVEFSIPKQATVSMKVFNVLGQEVAQLVNKEMTAGSYKVSFDASQLTSGIYFYTIQAGDFTATKKMMLLK